MAWKLENLVKHCNGTKTNINDKWVPARPINHELDSLTFRLKDAWEVFTGKSESFKWPEGQ